MNTKLAIILNTDQSIALLWQKIQFSNTIAGVADIIKMTS